MDAETDTLLGYGTQTNADSRALSTTGWAAAVDALFAQTKDNYSLFSDSL